MCEYHIVVQSNQNAYVTPFIVLLFLLFTDTMEMPTISSTNTVVG